MKASFCRNSGRPNKYLISCVSVLMCLVMCLTGCAFSIETPDDYERQIEPIPADTGHAETGDQSQSHEVGQAEFPDAYDGATDETEYEVEGAESTGGIEGLYGYTDEEIAASGASNVGRFAYERLDQTGKRVYNEIYLTLRDRLDDYELDCKDTDEIDRIFLCVMMDHPELFWVNGYVYTRYTRGDVLEAIGFRCVSTMDADTISMRQASIDAYVDNCLAGMPDADDYTRIKYVYEYIIKNTDYDPDSADNQNICSVFINGRSVCQGYAKATQYLLNKVGIPCTLVRGVVVDQGNHSWNLVRADGSYYYMDTTWGDANYRREEGLEGSFPSISYDYLCVPGYEIFKTHTPDSPVDLPNCTAIADNYYVREGAYFTAIDEVGFSTLFERASAQGSEFVSLKASSEAAYADIKRYLLDDQHVFDYLNTNELGTTISYWENRDLLTISFGLRGQ